MTICIWQLEINQIFQEDHETYHEMPNYHSGNDVD